MLRGKATDAVSEDPIADKNLHKLVQKTSNVNKRSV